ncbi:MAG: hypothetical protein ABIH25_02115 [Candidatus Woesearchaeota archaeon]
MKMDKKIGLCIVLLVFAILLIQNVFALGIAPARKVVYFEPGLEESVGIKIVNNDQKDMKVVLYAEGELANLVSLSTTELIFSSSEDQKEVSYKYKLPQNIEKPGEHTIEIVAREIPIKQALDGTSVSASIAVVSQLKINVPYPGKYAIAELKVAETGRTDQVNFIVVVNNLGTQKIVEAKGTIDIYGPTNEKIASVVSESGSIESKERAEFNAVWSGSINPGKYYAKLSVSYDGDVTEADKTFNVGNAEIEIKDISVRDFKLGQIAKFEILVENNWADIMKEVYTELIIKESGTEIGKFKSASEDVSALSKETLIAYWDTAGIDEGVYDATIVLYYNQQSKSQDMKAHISLTSIYFDAFGTGAVTGGPGGGGANWTIIAIGLLVIINIGWFVYFKFKNRKKK